MFDDLFEKLGQSKTIVLISTLVILDLLVFVQIGGFRQADELEVYFLDVGQGDSELVRLPAGRQGLPGGVEILIDGGPPNNRVVRALADVMPFTDRYIDLVLLTHAQTDHFGGLIEILNRYAVGVFLWNGQKGDTASFVELEKLITERSIPTIVVGKGDTICYKASCLYVLSPDAEAVQTEDINGASVVIKLVSSGSQFLFTGDISRGVERVLIDNGLSDTDVLKVPHHGSKYSSSAQFLAALQPKIAVIEVGGNSYGHPTKEVLSRLRSIGASVYRTDQDGTVRVTSDGNTLKILKGYQSRIQ